VNKYVQLSKKFNNRFWISENNYRFLKRLSINRLSFHITSELCVCCWCAGDTSRLLTDWVCTCCFVQARTSVLNGSLVDYQGALSLVTLVVLTHCLPIFDRYHRLFVLHLEQWYEWRYVNKARSTFSTVILCHIVLRVGAAVGHWTCNWQVAGSNPSRSTFT